LPGYQLAPATWLAAYVDTTTAIKAALNMPMELAVPFWWADRQYDGRPLLERIASVADSLAVMNYSTDLEAVRLRSLPFLDWSTRFSRAVRIALEAGPLANEERRHYHRAPAGELWQLELAGQTVLVLFSSPLPNAAGPAFKQSLVTTAAASAITFAGDREKMFTALPELEKFWSAWPNFVGAALHGLLP